MVWKFLRKQLCFKLYKMWLVQALTPADKVKSHDFCKEMQLKMEENDFLERIIFRYEATFHISGARWTDTMSISGEPSNHMRR